VEPNTWLWILAGFMALIFLGTGLLKLTTPRERLVEAGIGWTEDFSEQTIKRLGIAEVLGAVGLVLPGLIGVVPVLVPISACCLGAMMLGAIVVHVRRGEFLPDALRALALLVCCVLIAVYRFGPYPF
jgi:hypothetical protein